MEARVKAVLNALVHRDYAVGAPVQIRVHEDRLRIWNPGALPDGWTVKNLVSTHASTPFNPAIANAFFRSGEIETCSRGIQRIFTACKEAGTPRPALAFDGTDLMIEFRYAAEYLKAMPASKPPPGGQVTPEVTRLISVFTGAHSRREFQQPLGLQDDDHMRIAYIMAALDTGFIEMTIPDNTNSRTASLLRATRGWLSAQFRRSPAHHLSVKS